MAYATRFCPKCRAKMIRTGKYYTLSGTEMLKYECSNKKCDYKTADAAVNNEW